MTWESRIDEFNDPIEAQRRTMPNPNKMNECRKAGVRNCTDSSCSFYDHCIMAKPHMEYSAARNVPTLVDVDNSPPLSNTNPRRESKL